MDKTQFLDKYRALQTPANSVLLTVLKLWLLDGKSDDEIADALGKERSTAVRKIGNICKYFGTDEKGKKEQRQQLVLLFRKYCSEFEVHSNLYPDWVKPNSTTTKSENIVSEVVSIITMASTSFDLLGRDADRAELEKSSNQHKIVLLKAAAGIGKSTLAQEFLRTYFTKVIEINMALSPDDNAPASERLPIILKEFGEDASNNFGLNLETLKRRLSDKSQPSVAFLIDNIEPALGSDLKFLEKLRDYEGLLQVLGDRDVCSFTLITSRRSLIAQRVNVHEYLLQGLDIEAWREYFHDCENGATSEDLEQMCVAYNGNAKVMDILHGAIINRFDRNIAAYWNRHKNALLADAESETLISVEMDWLRDNQPDAYKLLCRMGCYRYQDVKTVPFEGLICLLWDVHESSKIGVLDYLSKSSLIESKGEYYLHPVVRSAAKSRLLENKIDLKETNHKAAEFWTKRVKEIETIDDALIAFEAYHHYLSIEEIDLASSVIIEVRKNKWDQSNKDTCSGEPLGYSFVRLGLLESIIIASQTMIFRVVDKLVLAELHNLVGDLLWLIGKPHRAIQNHEKTSDIVQNIYIKADNNLVEDKIRQLSYASLMNRGLCYLSLWDIDKAHDLFLQIENLSNQVNYKNSVRSEKYLFCAIFCLSLTYSVKNNIDQTFNYIEKYKTITNQINVDIYDSWSAGYSLVFIAQAYKNIEFLSDSIFKYEEAVKYSNSCGYSQVNAIALYGTGEIERAKYNNVSSLSNIQVAVEILKKIGATHDLAEAYFQLGLTYQAVGEQNQADTYKAKALKLFQQMEAPKQIDRVNQAFEQRSKQ